ncbi:MAG: MFS transporter [Candidatus Limnocylindria bacterium]
MAEVTEAATRGLFRNRAFLAIWSAQILSMTAANAVTYGLIVLVAELTKSNTSSSILILFAIVPAVLFGILAGVFVDRSDRKRVLIVTNALRALAVATFLFVDPSRVALAVPAAYVVNFVVAAITTFFVPAEAAMLPALVRRSDLLAANSLFTFTFNGAFLLGFIFLAPVVIAVAGFPLLFVVIGLMFVGAALLCLTLPPPPPPRATGHIDVAVAGEAVDHTRRELLEVLHFLAAAPMLAWALVYIAVTYTLVAVAGALAPGFVREVLGLGERSVVVLVGPAGLGVIAGLGVLNLIGNRLGRTHAIGLGLVVVTWALVVLAAARPVSDVLRRAADLGEAFPYFIGLVSVIALVFGVSYAFITVPSMTLLQEELRDDIRGRVFGVMNVMVAVFSLLPLLVVGPVADLWGVGPVFLAGAILTGVVWAISRAERKRARRTRAATGGAPEHA